MNRTRRMSAIATVAVLAIGGAAYGLTTGGDGGGDRVSAPGGTSTSVAESTTTTAEATTTTTSTPSTTTTAPGAAATGALRKGDRGPAVAAVQTRLRELHFDPGPSDGNFGQSVVYAVEAFQKLAGMGADGIVGPQVAAALAAPPAVVPLVPNGGADRVEVDLRRQLLFLYKGGDLRLISHVSTGSGKKYCAEGDCGNTAITPIGSFRFSWRYKGWRQSRLGKLYNPVYFTSSGVAIHGALSVPLYPASHGCVRIPMHIAEYFPSLVDRGDPVYVTDGRRVGPPGAVPSGPPPSDPPTTPGDDTSPTTTHPAPTTTAPPPTTTAPPPTTTTAPPPTTTRPPTTTTAPPATTTTTSTTVVPLG